jgi:hypothetical protein
MHVVIQESSKYSPVLSLVEVPAQPNADTSRRTRTGEMKVFNEFMIISLVVDVPSMMLGIRCDFSVRLRRHYHECSMPI